MTNQARAAAPQHVTEQQVAVLAAVFGVQIEELDTSRIADELEAQLAAVARLEELDLDGVEPALTFDPRWE